MKSTHVRRYAIRAFAVLAAIIFASALHSPCALAQSASGEADSAQYLSTWSDMLQALTAFVVADAGVAQGSDAQAAAGAREKSRQQFAAAIGWLVTQYPPRELARENYLLVPLLEETLGAMTAITRGLDARDDQQIALGRAWLTDTIASLQQVLHADPAVPR